MIFSLAQKIFRALRNPESLQIRWILYQQAKHKALIKNLPKMTPARLLSIIKNDLLISRGDTVCVHSAMGFLNVDLTAAELLQLLLDVVGPEGTLVFPSYPGASLEFLKSRQTFDVNTTSSTKATGLLTELAWKHPGALRSLHPTKSMAAIGPKAEQITMGHDLSAFPYDESSPYYKLASLDAKIIGLGVWTYNLSFVHCVEDTMRERFPFCPHDPELFSAICKDQEGVERKVLTFAHDLKRISFDTLHVQDYMRKHVAKVISQDLNVDQRRFFVVQAKPLYARMSELAAEGVTIFKRAQQRTTPQHERESWLQLQQQVLEKRRTLNEGN